VRFFSRRERNSAVDFGLPWIDRRDLVVDWVAKSGRKKLIMAFFSWTVARIRFAVAS
jgi:hypothetical protein